MNSQMVFNNLNDMHYGFMHNNDVMKNDAISDIKRQEEKRLLKRAANRKSASASRARRKNLMEEMAAEIETMRERAQVLALLPDLIVVLSSAGVINYVSEACENFVQKSCMELCNRSMFDIISSDCHDVLRELIVEALSPNNTFSTSVPVSHPSVAVDESSGNGGRSDHSSDTTLDAESRSLYMTVSPPSINLTDEIGLRVTDGVLARSSSDVFTDPNSLGSNSGDGNLDKSTKKTLSSTGSSSTTNVTASLSPWTSASAMSSEGSGSSSSGTSGSHVPGSLHPPSSSTNSKHSKHSLHHQHSGKLAHHRQRQRGNNSTTVSFGGKCRLCLLRRDNSKFWCEIRSSILKTASGCPEVILSLRPVSQEEGVGRRSNHPSFLSSLKILKNNVSKNDCSDSSPSAHSDLAMNHNSAKETASNNHSVHMSECADDGDDEDDSNSSNDSNTCSGALISTQDSHGLEDQSIDQIQHPSCTLQNQASLNSLMCMSETNKDVVRSMQASMMDTDEDQGGSSDDVRNAVRSLMLIHTGPTNPSLDDAPRSYQNYH